ncbi:ribosome-associated heat shock protein implicated in recycling of 50S subunit [Idiomarina sp. A28L]|uniref:ribosome-associated heat shock protein Hsp15 n=1 Tax=Idiomarina sp. A28L TaxID=1036674 RepID=UPI00021385C5|nr:ribosome-associated heat shock protein Hsp15 [Idiomarina sp. A28L]EGN74724.1 ribosome-associated heat shock protein implicated in recycling of 50S subunit [Idiomarina sp. A28L]
MSDSTPVRLDKWLWAARFFKTRGLARAAVQAGKVSYNGQRSKPAKPVELNAQLVIPRGNERMEVIVRGISEHRSNATEAQKLYEETAESVEKRATLAEARKLNQLYNPHPDHRPDKKERRELIKFKNQ